MKIKINRDALAESGIPEYMHESIIAYMETGRPVGSFLSAVLNNDLRLAIWNADNNNKHRLFEYVLFFYNHCPVGSWGHENATRDWPKELKKLEEKGDDVVTIR